MPILTFNDKKIKISAIYKQYNCAGLNNKDKWADLQNDMVDGMVRLINAFDKYIRALDRKRDRLESRK